VLLGALVFGALAGLFLSSQQTKQYTATAKLFISAQTGNSTSDLVQGSTFAQDRVKSYADVAVSRAVLVPVASRFGVVGGAGALASRVTAEVPTDTVIVRLSVRDAAPRRAAALANALGRQFTDVIERLELPRANGASSVRASIVEGAFPPSAASSPNRKVNVALGALVALVLAWLALILRSSLDTRVKTEDDVTELTALPILADIPRATRRAGETVTATDGHPAKVHAEAYRQLRTNLHYTAIDHGARSILVTSSVPAEGKSTVATNIAATMGETGARVILVDADLRRPTTAKYLGLTDTAGLASVLAGLTPLEDAVQIWGDSSVSVLSAGGTPPNPSELIASEAMSRLLAMLRESYDYVVVDSPPLLPVADASVLSNRVDGVIVVARAGTVRRAQLERSSGMLQAVNANVLGVVVNYIARRGIAGGYYGSYGYTAEGVSRGGA
jgi:capsular exopolysaccharide synthesis family protein